MHLICFNSGRTPLTPGIVMNVPTATVSELIETVGGAKVFSAFDFTSGYHQLKLNKNVAEGIGFVTRKGGFQYRQLAPGLTNGCCQFQRVMSAML